MKSTDFIGHVCEQLTLPNLALVTIHNFDDCILYKHSFNGLVRKALVKKDFCSVRFHLNLTIIIRNAPLIFGSQVENEDIRSRLKLFGSDNRAQCVGITNKSLAPDWISFVTRWEVDKWFLIVHWISIKDWFAWKVIKKTVTGL